MVSSVLDSASTYSGQTEVCCRCHYFGVDTNDAAGSIRCCQQYGQAAVAAGIPRHDHLANSLARRRQPGRGPSGSRARDGSLAINWR
jgi:hypothetical protein